MLDDEGASLPIGGPKQRAVLAALLLNADRATTRERLVDAVWGQRPPATARTALQVYVHGLRRALGFERIETVGTGYRIRLLPRELDLHRFEEGIEDAERALADGRSDDCVAAATAALALWSGPPLHDLADLPVAAAVVPRLEELQGVAAMLLAVALDADRPGVTGKFA